MADNIPEVLERNRLTTFAVSVIRENAASDATDPGRDAIRRVLEAVEQLRIEIVSARESIAYAAPEIARIHQQRLDVALGDMGAILAEVLR